MGDLLDHSLAMKLTNSLINEAKKHYCLDTGLTQEGDRNKKRRQPLTEVSAEIEDFEFENLLKYEEVGDEKRIDLGEKGLRLFLQVAPLTKGLDLKKEILLTMLSQMEKTLDNPFMKLEAVLHLEAGLRFHKRKPEELAETNDFIR